MKLLGIVLAAGAGSRMGMPKALVRDDDGVPWVVRSVRVLREGGCGEIGVVVGASADEVAPLLATEDVTIVPSPDWTTGMAASLRSGLTWAVGTDADAAVVHLVDLPDVHASVVRRIVADPLRRPGLRQRHRRPPTLTSPISLVAGRVGGR